MNAAPNLADLKAEAKSLGIDVDDRWGLPRLQREIEAKKAEKAESETPDPDGKLNTEGTPVNVGSTADPVIERHE